MPDELILEGADQPQPLKPQDNVEPESRIIYCYDRRRWILEDFHPPCTCHQRRFLHHH